MQPNESAREAVRHTVGGDSVKHQPGATDAWCKEVDSLLAAGVIEITFLICCPV